jgi:hypothetical protein
MPADEASRAAIFTYLAYKKQLVATTGHLAYSIKYELYEPPKINKETLQVQNMTESTVSQETNETTIMFCGYNCQSTYQIGYNCDELVFMPNGPNPWSADAHNQSISDQQIQTE